jgi:hypothetical protein
MCMFFWIDFALAVVAFMLAATSDRSQITSESSWTKALSEQSKRRCSLTAVVLNQRTLLHDASRQRSLLDKCAQRCRLASVEPYYYSTSRLLQHTTTTAARTTHPQEGHPGQQCAHEQRATLPPCSAVDSSLPY